MKSSLRGLVLAGGRSSRMGRDKAALVHPDGRTLLRRCQELLIDAGCQSAVVSLRHDQEVPAGLEHDEISRDPVGPGRGPISGIVSGMRLYPDSNWIVVACDLPRLDAATLRNLVAAPSEGEVFVAYRSESDGLPEPLCAYYGRNALQVLETDMAGEFLGLRDILTRHGCRLLDPVTPRALENANTPGDWEAAILR